MPTKNKLVCVVAPYEPSISETFIRDHVERLPAKAFLIHGWRPRIHNHTVLSFSQLVSHKIRRIVLGEDLNVEVTSAYVKAFAKNGVDAVLAEYGETGVQVLQGCRQLKIPLIVHFHGYDASVYSVLEAQRESYAAMFKEAAAIIAVSQAMERKLVSWGAPGEKVHYNPCGVDCGKFAGATPATAPPIFLAVGRFVEKKAPQATICAFNLVYQRTPDVRLRMIGDGPLVNECKTLLWKLGLENAVTLLGEQSPQVVQEEMRKARCFVQHSVQAPSGDCEGTPLGILEAGASSLPVISTRHEGIPEVVIEGETGFLVDEGDVEGMAKHMLELVEDPALAARLGQAARKRIEGHFSMERSISELWRVIESCIDGRSSSRRDS
jgi:glycosyltransferase involved in cell wall biosynthesis